MAAFEMTFGAAPQVRAPEDRIDPTTPHIKLLSVLVAEGGFQRFKTIAAAIDKADLERYLAQWLLDENNKRSFLRNARITAVAYVGKLD